MSTAADRHARLLLVLAALVCYLNALNGPFQFDDFPNIVQNPLVRQISGPGGLLALYHAYPTRFLGFLTFAANVATTGLAPFWFHATNIVVHGLTSLLVYELCRRCQRSGGAPLAAAAGALLFAVHPVQTQAVTYIVQRFASLAACFYIAALVCYLEASCKQRPRFLLLTWGFGLAAVFTKENAITLPAAAVALELTVLGTPVRALPRRWRRLLPLAALALVQPIEVLAFGHNNPVELALDPAQSPPFGVYLMTQAHVLLRYLQLIVWPTGQSIDYAFPRTQALDLPTAALAGLPLLALVLAWRWRRTARVASFGILLFLLGLLVEGLAPLPDVIFEHRLYLSMAGCALGVTAGLDALASRWPRRRMGPVMALTAAAGVALAWATWRRNEVWKSGTTLWSDALAKAPDNDRAYDNLSGFLLIETGDVPAAMAVAERWRDRHPPAPVLVLKLADYLDRMDREQEAVGVLAAGRRAYPRDAGIAVASSRALIAAGRAAEAVTEAEQAVALAPGAAAPRAALALARLASGGAAPDLLAELSPGESDAALLSARGRILAALGRHAEALAALDAAWSRDRTDPEPCFQAVAELALLDRTGDASRMLHACPTRLTTDYRVLAKLGETLGAAGLTPDAQYALAVALDLCRRWHPACPRQREIEASLAAAPPGRSAH